MKLKMGTWKLSVIGILSVLGLSTGCGGEEREPSRTIPADYTPSDLAQTSTQTQPTDQNQTPPPATQTTGASAWDLVSLGYKDGLLVSMTDECSIKWDEGGLVIVFPSKAPGIYESPLLDALKDGQGVQVLTGQILTSDMWGVRGWVRIFDGTEHLYSFQAPFCY